MPIYYKQSYKGKRIGNYNEQPYTYKGKPQEPDSAVN